ncbi:putative cyclic nucleotide-gated ion channel 17 [Raphanus sativus]|nr:putative cyclic nucleotide-gated ion channel 17 [Raphanus sativus]
MELKKDKLLMFYSDGKGSNWPVNDQMSKSYKLSLPPDNLLSANRITRYTDNNNNKSNNSSKLPWYKTILDPGSEIVLKWNWVFILSCMLALFIDPLYFFVPAIGGNRDYPCARTDTNLRIIVTFFRTIADLFYLLHIFVKFRTGFVAPNSSTRVFGRGELVMDTKAIAWRYLKSDFVVDLVATLPLPQLVIWFVMPATRIYRFDHSNNNLALIVLLQYIPRFYLIIPLSSQIVKATGVVTKTAWAGAAYNLLLYMLASHVLGAAWYILSFDRYTSCWKSRCNKESDGVNCYLYYLDCDSLYDARQLQWANVTKVFKLCDARKGEFKYGMFENAITKKFLWTELVHEHVHGETTFAVLIAIFGLVLFAHLIGNMQTYLQSLTVRLEEWRLKKRDTEEWMRHRQLPEDLRNRVRRYEQYKWLATKGVDEEILLQSLPTDLRRDIQRHLCLDLVRRVPFFSQMDDQLLDAICERLVSSLCTEGTYLVREGELITEMLFIIRGRLESSTTNGGRTGFFNSIILRPGDFCGEELLSWALLPKSTLNLPSSTRTVKASVEVEAFALRAEDLKFVANQFRRLHSKKLQHTFRFYSHHWRNWAACFIQAAWLRYKRRAMESHLTAVESNQSDEEKEVEVGGEEEEEECVGSSPKTKMNIGVMVLASRFAANTRRGIAAQRPRFKKPEDPDFSAEPDD